MRSKAPHTRLPISLQICHRTIRTMFFGIWILESASLIADGYIHTKDEHPVDKEET